MQLELLSCRPRPLILCYCHLAPVLPLQFVLRHQKFKALMDSRGAYWQLLSDRDVRMLPWLEAFQVRDWMAQPLPGLLFEGQLL